MSINLEFRLLRVQKAQILATKPVHQRKTRSLGALTSLEFLGSGNTSLAHKERHVLCRKVNGTLDSSLVFKRSIFVAVEYRHLDQCTQTFFAKQVQTQSQVSVPKTLVFALGDCSYSESVLVFACLHDTPNFSTPFWAPLSSTPTHDRLDPTRDHTPT